MKDPEFGAVGDGSVDDQPAIQAALAWTEGLGGGTVYFPPGRYRVDSTLQVYSGTHLEGCSVLNSTSGLGVSEIFAADGFNGSVIRNQSPATGDQNIAVRGLFINGSTSDINDPPAVHFTANGSARSRGLLVENCRIVRGGRATLEFERVSLSQIRSSFIGGTGPCPGPGIRFLSSWDNQIFGNQVTTGCRYEDPNLGGPGIEIHGASNVIEGNMIFWSTRGIEFYSPLQTIVGNRIEMNMGSGVYAETGQGAAITGNSIYLNGAGGPTFDVGAGVELANNTSGIAISGNLIANWSAWEQQVHKQRYGIAYRGNAESKNNVASGNVFQDMEIADTATVP